MRQLKVVYNAAIIETESRSFWYIFLSHRGRMKSF